MLGTLTLLIVLFKENPTYKSNQTIGEFSINLYLLKLN